MSQSPTVEPTEPSTEQLEAVPAPPRRKPWPVLIGAFVVALLIGAGVATAVIFAVTGRADSPTAAPARPAAAPVTTAAYVPPTFDMVGMMTLLEGFEDAPDGIGCRGAGGFSDIRPGAGVTIYDLSGDIVAVSSLILGMENASGGCEFFFQAELPVSAFYQVEVTHRGLITFDQNQARDGEVAITLGG